MMMNSYSFIILATLLTTFVLRTVAGLLNIGASKKGLPEEFADVYDAAAYRRSSEYLIASTRISLLSSCFDLAFLLLFWFPGGFNWLDQLLRTTGFSSLVVGVLYIGILILVQMLWSLPFGIYRTFVVEEAFGFNKTTPALYVADLLKNVILAVLLGTPLIVGILWFFEHAGAAGWLWAWCGVAAVTLLVQYVAPSWIMPLFNTFVPLEEGVLRESIEAYARRVEFPLSGIFVIDGSRRSSRTNAFFTGFGKRKRIALYDTLVADHSVEELVAVLAHEIGHFKKKHILLRMLTGFFSTGFLFFMLSLFLNNRNLFDAFAMQEVSVYGSLIFFSLLYSPIEWLLSVAMQMLSRRQEYESDAYALSTTQQGDALVRALKTLSLTNLSNLTPHPLHVFLNYSHPPVLQRIRRLKPAGAAESIIC